MSTNADNNDFAGLWRAGAQKASDGQLAVLAGLIIPVIAGFGLIVFTVPAARAWWPALIVPLFLSAFGFWGIADREIQERKDSRSAGTRAAWTILRVVSAALAVACAVGMGVLFLRFSIGTWIS